MRHSPRCAPGWEGTAGESFRDAPFLWVDGVSFRLTFWGTRGSIATPGPETAGEDAAELSRHDRELARMRRASTRVARHSLVWRSRITPLVQENEDAGYLDLLGGSCLMLVRASLGLGEKERRLLAPCVRALSDTLADLAQQPGDRATRQRAVDRSLEILRGMRSSGRDHDPEMGAALTAARVAITDLMLFAGVDPDEARVRSRVGVRLPGGIESSAIAASPR